MDHMTIHTGLPGDCLKLEIEWYDHNNIKRTETLTIGILERDKPRTLFIRIGDRLVYENQSGIRFGGPTL